MSDDRSEQPAIPEPGPNPPPRFDEPSGPAPTVTDPPLRNEEL